MNSRSLSMSLTTRQPPMVVQRGGPSPEIIRPNMESQDATGRDNDVVDFQEQNQIGVNENSINHGFQKESTPPPPPHTHTQVWR